MLLFADSGNGGKILFCGNRDQTDGSFVPKDFYSLIYIETARLEWFSTKMKRKETELVSIMFFILLNQKIVWVNMQLLEGRCK